MIKAAKAQLLEYVRIRLELRHEKVGPPIPELCIPELPFPLLDRAIETCKTLELPPEQQGGLDHRQCYEYVCMNVGSVLQHEMILCARACCPTSSMWLTMLENVAVFPPYSIWVEYAKGLPLEARGVALSVCKLNMTRAADRLRIAIASICDELGAMRWDMIEERMKAVEGRRVLLDMTESRKGRLALLAHQMRWPRIATAPTRATLLGLLSQFNARLLRQGEKAKGTEITRIGDMIAFGDLIVDIVEREAELGVDLSQTVLRPPCL